MNRLVQRTAGLFEPNFGVDLVGFQERANSSQTHTGGIERLNDAIVEIATQSRALFEIVAQGLLTALKIALRARTFVDLRPEGFPLPKRGDHQLGDPAQLR